MGLRQNQIIRASKCRKSTFWDLYTSVHVPQLIRAIDDKALAVKVFRPVVEVELVVAPQAAVVKPGGPLICGHFLKKQTLQRLGIADQCYENLQEFFLLGFFRNRLHLNHSPTPLLPGGCSKEVDGTPK